MNTMKKHHQIFDDRKARKPSEGDRVRDWWADKRCIQHSDLLRDRIDSAIRSAAIKERRRITTAMNETSQCDSHIQFILLVLEKINVKL